ncbi:hypothetical protein KUCAC02_007695 [Chaenocephalus aceratus]|uniref:Uncharacterized protein n=1 Tax=Chaenocephalus aceratus TaxID=36190 RepID=A0ACB9X812_CHAAC|nr:hypothetical protein KUCAC02_007695 [Chaenocephalus aceratus]
MICGNKCDKDFYREVQEEEIEQLVGGDEHCAYFEISAKKNTNVDQMFQTLFSIAKLPTEMSPGRHCKVSVHVQSDLMYIKEKAIGGSQTKEKGCIIC